MFICWFLFSVVGDVAGHDSGEIVKAGVKLGIAWIFKLFNMVFKSDFNA